MVQIYLIKQTKDFYLQNNENKKIKNLFNCKNLNAFAIAEFFYIIANLYASEKDYQLSNFYLKISLFLNRQIFAKQSTFS